METAVQVVWWVGLIVALLLTLVILKQVALVLVTLRDIRRLAGLTQIAAEGIARNLRPAPELAGLAAPGMELRDAAHAVARNAAALRHRLDALSGGDA